jgi:FKBP-type peptidyl-prolyl cis-trans isomerase FkpA
MQCAHPTASNGLGSAHRAGMIDRRRWRGLLLLAAMASVLASCSDSSSVDELVIEVINEGDGAEAVAGETVHMHYTGWLLDATKEDQRGKKFDSSRDRGTPFSFPLGRGRVIKGWDQGVLGMKVGGKRLLIIPSELGYGKRGAPGGSIPPNATLIFEVERLGSPG